MSDYGQEEKYVRRRFKNKKKKKKQKKKGRRKEKENTNFKEKLIVCVQCSLCSRALGFCKLTKLHAALESKSY